MALQLLERSLKRSLRRARNPNDESEWTEEDELSAEEATEEDLSTSSAMWRLDLAQLLGKTERQMLSEMPSIELTKWQARSYVEKAQAMAAKIYKRT